MSDILNGGWNSGPNAITVTIPVTEHLFSPPSAAAAEAAADYVSGTAARLARAEYLAQVEYESDA